MTKVHPKIKEFFVAKFKPPPAFARISKDKPLESYFKDVGDVAENILITKVKLCFNLFLSLVITCSTVYILITLVNMQLPFVNFSLNEKYPFSYKAMFITTGIIFSLFLIKNFVDTFLKVTRKLWLKSYETSLKNYSSIHLLTNSDFLTAQGVPFNLKEDFKKDLESKSFYLKIVSNLILATDTSQRWLAFILTPVEYETALALIETFEGSIEEFVTTVKLLGDETNA